jgi:SAM-dependent methyltransferase
LSWRRGIYFCQEKVEWYRKLYSGRESFNNKDEEWAYRKKQGSLTRLEVDALYRLIDMPPGSSILDAYCGNGRHAIGLAHKGFRVIGVDTSYSRIAFASNWARDEGANAVFLLADVRVLGLRPAFDAVLILGGSFSHSLEEKENIEILSGLTNLLKHGGLLLIDNPNPLRLWRLRNPKATKEDETNIRYFDLPLGTGEASGYSRYYSLREMKRLFHEAGLDLLRVFGDRNGGTYISESPRMIVIAKASNATSHPTGDEKFI